MKEVSLRMNEQEKYEVIKQLVDDNGKKLKAAIRLGITVRQVNRLIIKYKEKGKSAFVHGNRSRKPVNKLDSAISDTIILHYTNKYYGFNFKHYLEYLEKVENIKISYNCLYNLLKSRHILSPYAQKRTRKEAKKRELLEAKVINSSADDKIIDEIVSREIRLEDSHPRQSKPKYFGEIIEQDGSIHKWFGDSKTCLHLAIDKATSTIVGAYFDKEETLFAYYQVFYQILKNYGIPNKFFTDNRTVFNYNSLNPDKRTSDKDVLTQYGYACKRLGIELETSSVSQTKGTIERANGTFQRRLVQELRLNNITSIDKANEYLLNTFVPNFNKEFSLDYTKYESVFEVSPSEEIINYTLAVITERKLDNGNSIKFKNKYYQPYENGKIKCYLPKTECLVIEAFNKDLLVSIEDKVYELKEVEKNAKTSKEFDVVEEKPKEKTPWKPGPNHPWRLDKFRKHVETAHKNKIYA